MEQNKKKRTSDAIDNLLIRNLADGENGLLILSSPTGSGKSYALQRLMVAKAFDDPRALGGFVKTEYASAAMDQIRKRRVWYNTPLKNNLPGAKKSGKKGDPSGTEDPDEESKLRAIVRETAEDLGRDFSSDKKLDAFMSQHFLFLDAKKEPILESYSRIYSSNAPKYEIFQEFKEENPVICEELYDAVIQINKSRKTSDWNDERFSQACMDDFNKYQSAFCKRMKLFIESRVRYRTDRGNGNAVLGEAKADSREFYESPEEFAKTIRWEKSPWHWLGELYPAVYICITPIVILSTSKMYRVIDPVIEPAFNLYSSPDHKYVKDSVIIYDEFDTVKEWLLNTMLDDATKDSRSLDLVRLFYPLKHQLASWKSSGKTDLDYRIPDASDYLEEITDRCEKIWTTYHLDNPYKTEQGNQPGSVGYVFYDALGNTQVVDRNGQYTRFSCVHEDNLNRILLNGAEQLEDIPKEQLGSVEDLRNLVSDTQSFIYAFASCINQLADRYCEIKRTESADLAGNGEASEFSSENAVRTIVDEFQVDSQWQDYLSEYALQLRARTHYSGKTRAAQGDSNQRNLYTRGFSLLVLYDRADHDMRTRFLYYSFYTTPEALLLPLCRNCSVIGVSATAGLKNIKNFDIDYLSRELGDHYHSADNIDAGYRHEKYEDEFIDIEKTFQESQAGYGSPDSEKRIIPDPVVLSRDLSLGSILGENSRLVEEIEDTCGGRSYPLQRYVNLAYCMKEFLTKGIDSFLAVFDKFPSDRFSSEDENPFYRKDVEYIWDVLKGLCQSGQKVNLFFIRSKNFREEWGRCKKALENDEKCFIISTINTLGNGQNLQYRIPASFRSGSENGTDDRTLYSTSGGEVNYNGEKDFDAIYIERPSHILEYFSGSSDSVSIRQLYAYILYAEYAKQYNYISYSQYMKILQAGFSAYGGAAGHSRWKLSQLVNQIPTETIYAKVLIQAIGRICRTSTKRKSPAIYLDPDLKGNVARNGRLIINPEAEAALEKLSDSDNNMYAMEFSDDRMLNRMMNVSAANAGHIDSFQRQPWTEPMISEWESIRDLLLRLPQPDEELFNAESTSNDDRIYIYKHYLDRGPDSGKRKTIYYKTEDNFRTVHLSFEHSPEYCNTITAENTNLASFARNETIRRCFDQHGYALSFCEDAQFVMDPATATRLYMGALGEAAGRALFEKWFPTMPLEPIHDLAHYEFFDYRFADLPIYVDFKNWNTSLLERLDDFSMEVPNKIAAIGEENCRLVLIVNILAPVADSSIPKLIPTDNGKIILVPSLLDPDHPEKEADGVFQALRERILKIKKEVNYGRYKNPDQPDLN